MAVNIERLCPGCMRELGIESKKAEKCPYCGYGGDTYKQNARCLPVNTILAGKYLVGAVLGEGGFGITYMGYDLNMETRIAIKEYFPVELVSRDTTSMTGDRVISLSGDKSVTYKQGLKKYVTEAQNVSLFSETPGVVSVKDFFYENETAYIVMEYIEGISLKDYLKERGGRLSEEESLAIMKPVLEALVKVHESGIIHRDISPDNIMLTFFDKCNYDIASVKLIDFGAARMTAKNDQKSLTIILKHGYAPEEQYRTHGEQGPWTDVYAVCAVLYRMLTGQTPVPAMDRLFQDDLKSFDDLNTKVSKNTAAAILKGFAVKKEDRIQNMAELIDCLYAGKAVKGTRKRLAASWMIGAACLGVMAILGGSLALVRSGLRKEEILDEGQFQEVETGEDGMEREYAEEDAHKEEIGAEETEIKETETKETGTEEIVVFEEEKLGETIAYPDPQTSIGKAYNGKFVLFRMPDGTVQAKGKNESGQCMVDEWHDIVAVSAGYNHSLGLRSDGKVVAVGDNSNGQCDVENWENIVQIAAGGNNSYGLTKEGKVLSTEYFAWVDELEDIVVIASAEDALLALDKEGNVRGGGFSETGWKDVRHLHYLGGDIGVLVGIREDGKIVRTLDKNMVGVPGQMEKYSESMEDWSDIQQLDIWLGVKKDGTVTGNFSLDGEMGDVLAQWTEMEGVALLGTSVFGLRRDGSILEYCSNYDAEAGGVTMESLLNQEKLEWIYAISYEQQDRCLIAGTEEGKILCYGNGAFSGGIDFRILKKNVDGLAGQVCGIGFDEFEGSSSLLFTDGTAYWGYKSEEIEHWERVAEDAKQIVPFSQWYHGGIVILKENGRIEIKKCIRDGTAKLYEEYCAGWEWDWIDTAESWTDVVQIAGNWYDVRYGKNGIVEFYGLHSDGTISATNPDRQEEIAAYSGISKLVERDGELLGIREDGTAEVIIASEKAVIFGRTQVANWSNLQDIAMGGSHVVGLRKDGTVVAAGSNHEGQCDVEDWSDIVYLTTGENCTLGITSDGQLKMAGHLY